MALTSFRNYKHIKMNNANEKSFKNLNYCKNCKQNSNSWSYKILEHKQKLYTVMSDISMTQSMYIHVWENYTS